MKRGLITTILTITCLAMVFGGIQVSAQENTEVNQNVLNINGKFISQGQFQRELTNELNKEAGKSLTEDDLKAKVQKVLDNIIRNELLYQECEKINIVVPEDEINEKLDAEKSKFSTPEEYQDSLKNANKDEEIRKSEIKRNLAIKHLINEKFQPSVTDKEISAYYKDNKDTYKDVTLEEARDEIERKLKLQKLADSYNQFYTELKSKAKVEVLMK
ncbi:MAG: SurA N-terminal domain-containing protein [Deltaproteobacteria bacterium]|nr:SurA N-terminal domain-containing protein [Deltaproteobacteria bacterium]